MLKIKPGDLDAIRAAVAPLDTDERRDAYARGDFPRAELCRDLDKRYRWDLLHESGYRIVSLYDYLDDRHIDSALRAVVRPIGGAR